MASRLAAKEVTQRARGVVSRSAEKLAQSELKTRIDQARVLADNLSQLKGAAMKAGQLLSIDSSDILPPEATEILSKLQSSADPVPFETLRPVLEQDLAPQALAELEDIEEQAAASASIGQVHRATFRGEEVAVKIQYQGIADSIDSDISVLRKVASTWLTVSRSKVELDELFEEFREILHQEANYESELANMAFFYEALADDQRFVVPKPHAAVSGKRVLTMSWEEGMALQQWIASAPSQVERERFAKNVLDLYCKEFFEWGVVQTDPNYGNFLVRPESGQIVLLDFGATLRYENTFVQQYKAVLRTIESGSDVAIVDSAIAFGLLDEREGSETREAFVAMMHNALEPFDAARQPFVFRDEGYDRRAREIGYRFVRSVKYSPPPRRLVFLHRKLGGIFQLLRRLDLTYDLRPFWEQMIAE